MLLIAYGILDAKRKPRERISTMANEVRLNTTFELITARGIAIRRGLPNTRPKSCAYVDHSGHLANRIQVGFVPRLPYGSKASNQNPPKCSHMQRYCTSIGLEVHQQFRAILRSMILLVDHKRRNVKWSRHWISWFRISPRRALQPNHGLLNHSRSLP